MYLHFIKTLFYDSKSVENYLDIMLLLSTPVGVGITFGAICLSIYLSVCLFVCSKTQKVFKLDIGNSGMT